MCISVQHLYASKVHTQNVHFNRMFLEYATVKKYIKITRSYEVLVTRMNTLWINTLQKLTPMGHDAALCLHKSAVCSKLNVRASSSMLL